MNRKDLDKGISDICGCLTDAIIVMPGGWGDSLPEWLKPAITLERLAMNMRALRGEPITGTDAEACAYLYTASLTAPMGEQWTRIYLHIAGLVAKRHQKTDIPTDIAVDTLDQYDNQELARLKAWLYHKRTTARQEQARAERRTQKVQEPALVTMPLFKF